MYEWTTKIVESICWSDSSSRKGKRMKTLYFTDVQACWGTIFLDEEANLVGYIHENDGTFRPEYMGFIAEFFDGKVVRIDLTHVEKKSDEDLEAEDFVSKFHKQILRVIQKAAKKK